MKVQIYTPFYMQWIEGYCKAFETMTVVDKPRQGEDVILFMWGDKQTRDFIRDQPKTCKYIVFIRRYEFFSFDLREIDWSKVDAVIVVNDYLGKVFRKMTGITPHVIYNGVDPSKWKFKTRGHGKKMALVGYVNKRKNIPLALQIMASLPGGDWELHMAGGIQDGDLWCYIGHMVKKLGVNLTHHNHVPPELMNDWLDQYNYLINPATSEGCPNCVIEALAKGIKPIVHNWPGAEEQFGDLIFNTVEQAVLRMNPDVPYESEKYRKLAEEKFGWANYEKVKEIVNQAMGGKNASAS